MKKIVDMNFGFSDAENYKRRENKQLFQRIFVQNEYLDQILDPGVSFIVGEKGTGKTAYGIFLSNTDYQGHKSTLRFLRETEYDKFIQMKRDMSLTLSDYTEIWKAIILLIFCETLAQNIKKSIFSRGRGQIQEIKNAIDEFYASAFAPELINALQLVENAEVAAKILSKYAEAEARLGSKVEYNEKRFQTNLLYIRRRFESAISAARLEHDFLLFIDGIDIRPSAIPFNDYLECIKGLANAVWHLNNDFFSEIKDSRGRLRTILLVRPDIFLKLGLQNPNTKLRDNSVVLDWITTYKGHRSSKIFDVADSIFRVQQDEDIKIGEAWDHYFPFDIENVKEKFKTRNSFIWFLRNSLYRPRDIVTYVSIFNKYMSISDRKRNSSFPKAFLENRDITNEYAEYLLGELRDQLVFYYSQEEYDDFLQFFDFLNGNTRFSYEEYLEAHAEFLEDLKSRNRTTPEFMETANLFLQFLYEMNVISFIEVSENGGSFIHWCFRERTNGKIAPKVKVNCRYEVHYGLVPALNMGKRLKSRKKRKKHR